MAEAIKEQVFSTIVNVLSTLIVADGGVTYWYTPTAVVRIPALTNAFFNSNLGSGASPVTIYGLIPDEAIDNEECSQTMFSRAGVFLVLAQAFKPSSEDPFTGDTPLRHTIQNRMERDVKRALLVDPQAGGLLYNVFGDDSDKVKVDMSPEHTYMEDWAVVFMHFRPMFSYAFTAP